MLYDTLSDALNEVRGKMNGHASENPLSWVTDGERQLHGGNIGRFPTMYSLR